MGYEDTMDYLKSQADEAEDNAEALEEATQAYVELKSETNAELATLRRELAEAREELTDANRRSSNTEAVIEEISELFPDNAAHKYGSVTAVSLLDDVRDSLRELAKAQTAVKKADGLGEHSRELRLALAAALTWILGELPPPPHEGSCGGPDNLCDQACADAANAYAEYHRLFKIKNKPPHYFEEKSEQREAQATEAREQVQMIRDYNEALKVERDQLKAKLAEAQRDGMQQCLDTFERKR